MSRYDDFNAVLSLLHEATLDESLWPAVEARMKDACGTGQNALAMASGASRVDSNAFFAHYCDRGKRFTDGELEYFNDHYPHD